MYLILQAVLKKTKKTHNTEKINLPHIYHMKILRQFATGEIFCHRAPDICIPISVWHRFFHVRLNYNGFKEGLKPITQRIRNVKEYQRQKQGETGWVLLAGRIWEMTARAAVSINSLSIQQQAISVTSAALASWVDFSLDHHMATKLKNCVAFRFCNIMFVEWMVSSTCSHLPKPMCRLIFASWHPSVDLLGITVIALTANIRQSGH